MIRERTFANMKIGDVMELVVKQPTVVSGDTSMNDVLKSALEDTRTRHVYVVDSKNKLTGVIRMTDVVEFLFPFTSMMLHATDMTVGNMQEAKAQTAEQVMDTDPYFVKKESTISEAARIMIKEKINELPIIDDNRMLIGQVNVYEFISAYLKEREFKS